MVHEIFHDMSDIKESGFYSVIHVATETHDKVLNIVASLNSDLHEATNPVIEGSSMLVFNLFQIFSNKRCRTYL